MNISLLSELDIGNLLKYLCVSQRALVVINNDNVAAFRAFVWPQFSPRTMRQVTIYRGEVLRPS